MPNDSSSNPADRQFYFDGWYSEPFGSEMLEYFRSTPGVLAAVPVRHPIGDTVGILYISTRELFDNHTASAWTDDWRHVAAGQL